MIELFSGSKVMSETFKEADYEVFTIDNNPDLEPDLCINMLEFEISMLPERFRHPDVIWASSPCTTFSVASIGIYWKNGKPKNSKTLIGMALAMKTLEIIKELKPKYYFMENPRGMMRKQYFMQDIPRKTVTYCQYGAKIQKPTDIWTNSSWIPKKKCNAGDSCHEKAGRGSKTGLQGLYSAEWEKARGNNGFERAKIPKELCKEIVAACNGEVDKLQLSLTSPSFQATPSTQEG